MNNEFYVKGLENLNDKIDEIREIVFSLNDYNNKLLNKEYYFTFEVTRDALISFSVDESYGEIALFIDEVKVINQREFYLKKGVYQVKIVATLVENITINVKVKGFVKYYNKSTIKVLNGEDFSIIAVFSDDVLQIFQYTSEAVKIDEIETKNYDACLFENNLMVFYITEKGFVKKTYYIGLNTVVTEEQEIDNLSDVKCLIMEKWGYIFLKMALYTILMKKMEV